MPVPVPVPACGPDPGWSSDDLRESVLALLMRSRSPEQVSGHLRQETDLMLFRRHSQAVLALHESATRACSSPSASQARAPTILPVS